MEVLKARRARVKGTLTRISTFAENISSATCPESLRIRLEKLNDCWTEFNQIQDQMCQYVQESGYVDQEGENEQFETRYFSVKEILVKELNNHRTVPSVNEDAVNRLVDQQANFFERFHSTTANPSTHESCSDAKLPKIIIPSFSGDYTEWVSFRDLFISSVHDNPHLTSTQKFHYLKGLLRDDAAALLRHIPVSESNYSEAWERLDKRYDKRSHIVKSYIKRFLNLSSNSSNVADGLRRVSDGADEIIRGLRALGPEAEGRDPWLIFLLLSKVDAETRQAWSENIIEKEYPTVTQFLEFLDKRRIALEDCQTSTSRNPTRKSSSVKSLHSEASPSSTCCPKCKAEHFLFQCPSFRAMDISSRRAFTKDQSLCFNCLRGGHTSGSCQSKLSCQKCHKHHHTLVHLNPNENSNNARGSATSIVSTLSADGQLKQGGSNTSSLTTEPHLSSESITIINNHSVPSIRPYSLLPTAIVYTPDFQGKLHSCRVLLDSGSQVSFVTEAFAKKLGIPRQHARISVQGLSSAGAGFTRGVVGMDLFSRFNKKSVHIDAFILRTLTSFLPSKSFNIANWDYINTLQLADPNFHEPGPIDLLLGADKLFFILENGRIQTNPEYPVTQLTFFGWVLAGVIPERDTNSSGAYPDSIVANYSEVDLDITLRKFWEIENVTQTIPLTQEEQMAEEHFVQTHTRSVDGRYVLEVPFKEPLPKLGTSLNIAIRRLNSMESRFQRDDKLRAAYTAFMEEYLNLGHMEEIAAEEMVGNNVYYLPHHAIIKADSTTTKLRVVFDGSCQPPDGLALNKALLIGPPILRDLLSICIRFRQHRFVFTADIEKMYRQILISQKHMDFQRIVWRDSPEKPIKHYRLCTVTYGTSSAPFLAVRTLRQLARDYEREFPSAAVVLLNEFYMDDVMTGSESVSKLLELKNQLSHLLKLSGFQLRKWSSNCSELLKSLPETECELSPLELEDDTKCIKVLGLRWNPSSDVFSYKVSVPNTTEISKRQILSTASRIFDPLGFLMPFIINIKIFFQKLWLENLNWDDRISRPLAQRWLQLKNDMKTLELVRVPRHIWSSRIDNEIHAFCDSSEDAYAAVIYVRSLDSEGKFQTIIIAAKSKVAPIQQISLPRLELCGAVLLCRLLKSIIDSLKMDPKIRIFAWTDSKLVLQWLSSPPRRWKTFVANRSSEILELLPRNKWRHVPSELNPADCASRGIPVSELINHPLWWNGPAFLRNHCSAWPESESLECDLDGMNSELRGCNIPTKTLIAELPNSLLDELAVRTSTWTRLLRIIALCLRFSHNIRNKASRVTGGIKTFELTRARNFCIKTVQQSAFHEEITLLQSKKKLPAKGPLIRLSPFIDQSGMLRVGGRLESSTLSFDAKHPIILPKNHYISELVIREYHTNYLHVGVNELFVLLKQKFWIIGCRNLVRKLVHQCIPCFRHRKASIVQLMGNLPASRVQYARPFSRVGVDYAGPITMRLHRGRNSKRTKGYTALFVCFITKALHLEVVSDLTTEAFLAALKRFIARRGKPTDIYSDNGTNFKGAHRSLSEMHRQVLSQSHNTIIEESLARDGITWHFIPPNAPHFGGLWEAGVKSVKQHLKRVINNNILTYEEFSTVLAEIEAILNSRPLCASSDTELDPLTPAHFLIGCPYTAVPEPDLLSIPINRLSNWRLLQNLKQGFWKRWHTEYLTSLQQRPKWHTQQPEVQEDDLVVIKEANLPPSKWILARVIKKHPGPDGLTRVVSLKTAKGAFKRPICKIVPLPKS